MFRFQRIHSSVQTLHFTSRINPSTLNLASSFHYSSAMSSPSTSTPPPLNLIPIAAPSQSALFPFPGFTHKSAETVRKLLDDNHKVRQHQIGLEMSYLLIRLSLCTHIPRLNILCPFLSLSLLIPDLSLFLQRFKFPQSFDPSSISLSISRFSTFFLLVHLGKGTLGLKPFFSSKQETSLSSSNR